MLYGLFSLRDFLHFLTLFAVKIITFPPKFISSLFLLVFFLNEQLNESTQLAESMTVRNGEKKCCSWSFCYSLAPSRGLYREWRMEMHQITSLTSEKLPETSLCDRIILSRLPHRAATFDFSRHRSGTKKKNSKTFLMGLAKFTLSRRKGDKSIYRISDILPVIRRHSSFTRERLISLYPRPVTLPSSAFFFQPPRLPQHRDYPSHVFTRRFPI